MTAPALFQSEDEKQEKSSNIRSACSEFAENSSLAGLINIKRTSNLIVKFIWIVVFLAAVAICIWQIHERWMKYFTYPTITTITLNSATSQPFPSVTICNLNPMSRRKFKNMDFVKRFDGLMGDMTKGSMAPPKPGGNESSAFNWKKIDMRKKRCDMQIMGNFTAWYTNLTTEERRESGMDLEKAMMDCFWQGVTCYPGNFTFFTNPYLGNCFTFNAYGNLSVKRTGPNFGLSVTLFIDQDDYVPQLADAAGVKVVIGNQSRMPYPEDEGVLVRPGTRTQLGIRKSTVVRAGYPWGKCANLTYSVMRMKDAYVNDLPLVNYSTIGCLKTCRQRNVMLNCSCFDPNYASPNTDALKDLSSKAKHPCSTDTESECMSRVYSLIDASDVCDIKTCPPICKEFKYRIATSAADWPSKPKIPAIMNMIKKVRPALDIYEEEETNTTTTNSTTNATASDSNSTSSTDEPTTTTITVTSPVITTTVSSMAPAGPSPSPSSLAPVTITSGTQAPAPPPPPPPPGPKKGQVNPQYISENFIKIDVYFEDLNEEIYVTTAAYSEIDLLTDMGGTCGLWMGISVIAIIEVIQFCVEVGLLCFYRYKTSEETKVKPLRQSPNRSPYRERSVTPQTEEWYLDDIPEKNGIYNDRKF